MCVRVSVRVRVRVWKYVDNIVDDSLWSESMDEISNKLIAEETHDAIRILLIYISIYTCEIF